MSVGRGVDMAHEIAGQAAELICCILRRALFGELGAPHGGFLTQP